MKDIKKTYANSLSSNIGTINYSNSLQLSDPINYFFHQAVDDFLNVATSQPIFKSSDEEIWAKSHPRVNSFRDKQSNTLVVDFIVPYYKKEELLLEIDDYRRIIQLTGKNNNEDNIPESDHIVRGVSRGNFKKTLVLDSNEPYDLNSVRANHQDGVLRLTFDNLKPKISNRKVEIK